MSHVNKKELFFDNLSLIFFTVGLITLFIPSIIKRLFFDDVRDYGLMAGTSYIGGVLIIISIICIVFSILKYGIKWWRTSLVAFEAIMFFGLVMDIILSTSMSSGLIDMVH